jgi:hypothetical protein
VLPVVGAGLLVGLGLIDPALAADAAGAPVAFNWRAFVVAVGLSAVIVGLLLALLPGLSIWREWRQQRERAATLEPTSQDSGEAGDVDPETIRRFHDTQRSRNEAFEGVGPREPESARRDEEGFSLPKQARHAPTSNQVPPSPEGQPPLTVQVRVGAETSSPLLIRAEALPERLAHAMAEGRFTVAQAVEWASSTLRPRRLWQLVEERGRSANWQERAMDMWDAIDHVRHGRVTNPWNVLDRVEVVVKGQVIGRLSDAKVQGTVLKPGDSLELVVPASPARVTQDTSGVQFDSFGTAAWQQLGRLLFDAISRVARWGVWLWLVIESRKIEANWRLIEERIATLQAQRRLSDEIVNTYRRLIAAADAMPTSPQAQRLSGSPRDAGWFRHFPFAWALRRHRLDLKWFARRLKAVEASLQPPAAPEASSEVDASSAVPSRPPGYSFPN